MRSPEEIQDALQEHRLEVVAAETGLSYGTVRRYAAGQSKRPSLDTIERLSAWLDAQGASEIVGAGSR